MKDVLLIVWSERLELGIPILDEQHRVIAATMNSLYFMLSKNLFNESILHIARMILHHVRLHHFTEEYVLEQARYPDLENHRVLHRECELNLTAAIRKTIQAYEQNAARSDDLMLCLKQYWLQHICKEDRKFLSWFHSRTA